MRAGNSYRAALATALAACFIAPAGAQTAGTPIATGTAPLSVAINPITNKLYVANSGSDNVTVINATTGAVVTTIPVGDYPAWIAANSETGRIYVSTLLGANTTILASNDTVLSTQNSGGGGWTTVDPWTNSVYVIRYGDSDEFNWIVNDQYQGTSATRSLRPVSQAFNPVTQRMYMVHEWTGDVVVMDLAAGYTPYPTLYCPNGSGGFKPQPTTVPIPVPPGYVDPWNNPSEPKKNPCVDVPDDPKWVAVNPVTNTVYVIGSNAATPVSIINGTNSTSTNVAVPGGFTGGKFIAVNPVSNKVYAVFANGVVQINPAASNAQTPFPTTGTPVGIAINTFTNKVYVPMSNATMLVINANNNTSTVVAIPTGATAIAVNPLTNTVYITDSNNQITPVVGLAGDTVGSTGITTTVTALPGNSSSASGSFSLSASSSFAAVPLNTIRKVYYRIDNGPWTAATGNGPYTAAYSGLSVGAHTIQAFATNGLEANAINHDNVSAPVLGNVVSYNFSVAASTAPAISLNPTSLSFAGSMGATSLPQSITVTNSGTAALTISNIAIGGPGASQFAQSNNCSSVAPSATCTISVTFTPAAAAGELNSTVSVSASLNITHNATGSPTSAALNGSAEKSLVTHFYEAILGRAPDAGGKNFWGSEAQRLKDLGANVNEVWYAMANSFFSSAEYTSLSRDDNGFVTDLYKTFFNRAPDGGGLAFWAGQLGSGMPRGVVLVSFMLSPEFTSFAQGIFGNTAARAEVDVVVDFYRGTVARLPDAGGFNAWVGQFRTAQCQGGQSVYNAVDAISSAFINGAEYANRNRSNSAFVGDMYNTFLRRGGDQGGVQYWIGELDAGRMSRDQVRRAFIGTSEFNGRVTAIVNQGCIQ